MKAKARFCESCKSPLFNFTRWRRVGLSRLLQRKFRHFFKVYIGDEIHKCQNGRSDIGAADQRFLSSIRYSLALTGTFLGAPRAACSTCFTAECLTSGVCMSSLRRTALWITTVSGSGSGTRASPSLKVRWVLRLASSAGTTASGSCLAWLRRSSASCCPLPCSAISPTWATSCRPCMRMSRSCP